jgi:hypothetical protein
MSYSFQFTIFLENLEMELPWTSNILGLVSCFEKKKKKPLPKKCISPFKFVNQLNVKETKTALKIKKK